MILLRPRGARHIEDRLLVEDAPRVEDRAWAPLQDRGFTLIEILVALVIVAVGMAALMGALSSSANSVSYMRDKTFAEWVALNQITNLRLQQPAGQIPPVANTNGDIEFAGRNWHWRQEVVATQAPGIVRIDVKVRPAEVKAGDDAGWFVTVSGLAGDSFGSRGTATPTWDSQVVPNGFGNQAQNAGGLNTGSTNPGAPGSTTTLGNGISSGTVPPNGTTPVTPPVSPQPNNSQPDSAQPNSSQSNSAGPNP